MSLKPLLYPSRKPVITTGGFGTKNDPTLKPQTPTAPPGSVKPSGNGFGAGLGSTPKPPNTPNASGTSQAIREGLEISFGKESAVVEKITKSTNPRGLEQLGQFGDEIASGVGKAVGSSLDDFGRLLGKAGSALGGLAGIAGAASLGADVANLINKLDPGGKAFLDDFNWQTGRPNTPPIERQTSGFIPGPIPSDIRNPDRSKTPLGSPTNKPVEIGTPARDPIKSPSSSPASSPSSPKPGISPTSNPFTPPQVETPGKSPDGKPLQKGAGGVNLNKPIWERLNELEQKEPDLEPIVGAMTKIGAAIITGVGGLIQPAVAGAIFTAHLTNGVMNVIKGLTLSTAFSIPQAMTTTALIPNTLTSSALLPKTLTSTALLPKTLTSTALLPKTLTSTALIPNVLTSSAIIPQTLTKSAIFPQTLEGFLQLPEKELEFDFNLGQKNINFELDLGEKEIEINIPAGNSNIELDVNLDPVKNEIKNEIKKESEKCRKGHEEHCKKTGDDVKKIKEKLEIEFPEIAGEGEIVCRDVRTPYAYKEKGFKGVQQMLNIQMELSKNILSHICNGLQPQQETLTGALDYQLCEKTENGDIIITPNPYEGVGLRGIQAQIHALANLNKYMISEVCKHEKGGAYPVFADPHLEEFPILRQLTFTLVESQFYPYQEGSLWHMTIPLPKPDLTWDDFVNFEFFKGAVFGKINWQNSKVWSGGYFRDEDEARRVLAMMENLSTLSKSGDYRIGKGGNPRKPQIRQVRAVRAVVADLNPVTGDPETVLSFIPPER